MATDFSYDLLIIGAGHAGRNAARSARAANATCSIALVGEEGHFPYERPALSKEALLETASWEIPPQAAEGTLYRNDRIDVFLNHRVNVLDSELKIARSDGGLEIAFNKAIIATGSRLKSLPHSMTAGLTSDDLFYLRTRDDAARLRHAMSRADSVVVIGAGFIGLEVACSARSRGLAVTVIDQAPRILSRALPACASQPVMALHCANGVDFRLETGVRSMTKHDSGRVRVETTNGAVDASLVVVGIGVGPEVALADAAGLHIDDGIVVDAYGRTNIPDIYAAGEVTRHPAAGYDAPQRFESWQVAELQARAVGATAAGCPTAYTSIPWFWSDQYGVNIQCLGNTSGAAHVVTRSGISGAFSLFFLNSSMQIAGMIAFNNGRDVSATRRLIAAETAVDPVRLADPQVTWRAIMNG